MLNFIQGLINLRREKRPCDSCEVLKHELALKQQEVNRLLDRVLEKPPQEIEEIKEVDYSALKPKYVPWNVRQQILERESFNKAKLLRDKQKEIDDAKKSTATTEEREKLVVGEK